MKFYDKIIIGGGLYGLYSSEICGRTGQKIIVLEHDSECFKRATYINQARVHMGYHYPRSFSTATKSANYFEKFNTDFSFCINKQFEKIYAISKDFSWTNAEQFKKFCVNSNIPCDEIDPSKYFKKNTCEVAFVTQEYTYDAKILRDFLLEKIKNYKNVEIMYNARIKSIEKDSCFTIKMEDGTSFKTKFILNATYASTNQVSKKLNFENENFKIKYELCEIILCKTNDVLNNIGITVMDGPFFSIMPFGKTGLHSLTSVTFTPHMTSNSDLPTFECQKNFLKKETNVDISTNNKSNTDFDRCCSPSQLGNCNECKYKPDSAWPYMSRLAKKYLKSDLDFHYHESLFSMKSILKSSEIDDSRPTVIKMLSKDPTFISVLSGKINTVYDLNEVLLNE